MVRRTSRLARTAQYLYLGRPYCYITSTTTAGLTGSPAEPCSERRAGVRKTLVNLPAQPLRLAVRLPTPGSPMPLSDNPGCSTSLGIPTEYIKTGGVGDALNVNSNLSLSSNNPIALAQIQTEISAGRPIAVDIAWNGGAQHCVAIAGVLDDILLICDPASGESTIQYESFPAAYQGGATFVGTSLTKKGT